MVRRRWVNWKLSTQQNLLLAARIYTGSKPIQPLIAKVQKQSGQGVKPPSYLHLVQRFKLREAITTRHTRFYGVVHN